MSKTPAIEPDTPKATRLEKILSVSILAIVAVTIICFFSVIIATATGAAKSGDFNRGIWPAVFTLQYWGLPVAFLLLVLLLVTNSVRRSKAAKSARR
ncbi:MAG: multidrug ABC transporter ATPase [Microbacteriaceae bacterium]|nr:multidrug ABC transporter ATPase [Cryobacterium sp.]MCC6376465.1 multidrug ABC transporter ATPase [Microbacteriaceae bacterium]